MATKQEATDGGNGSSSSVQQPKSVQQPDKGIVASEEAIRLDNKILLAYTDQRDLFSDEQRLHYMEEWYFMHKEAMFKMARKRSKSDFAAEDIAQNALIQLLARLNGLTITKKRGLVAAKKQFTNLSKSNLPLCSYVARLIICEAKQEWDIEKGQLPNEEEVQLIINNLIDPKSRSMEEYIEEVTIGFEYKNQIEELRERFQHLFNNAPTQKAVWEDYLQSLLDEKLGLKLSDEERAKRMGRKPNTYTQAKKRVIEQLRKHWEDSSAMKN